MKFIVDHIEELLHRLSKKTKQPLDHHGFESMSDSVNQKIKAGISSRYLYETLYRRITDEKKKGNNTMVLQPNKVVKIAQYLGFENFEDFIQEIENPLPSVAQKCVGSYRCYLRRNTDKGVVLCSPVQVMEIKKKIHWLLKGPERDYVGEVDFKNNCLFVLMKEGNGKQFHHVYQIGQKEMPYVLQGVFSGVSTTFEPIGGRVVLVRTTEKFESLKIFSAEIVGLKKSKSLEERRIAEYFHDYPRNNLTLRRSMTFSLDDLGDCR